MMRVLDVTTWEWITILHQTKGGNKRHRVQLIPASRGKIAVSTAPAGRGHFFWFNRKIGKWVQVTDLYALRRAFAHITWGNAIETDTLERALKELHDVQFQLSVPGMSEETERELRRMIGTNVRLLETAIDLDKVEAYEQLTYLFTLRDSKGRKNRGVLRCRSTTAINRIAERVEGALGIGAAFARHLGVARQLLWCSEYLVNAAERALRDLVKKPSLMDAHRLTKVLDDVSQLRLPPFSWNSNLICDELTRARGLLTKKTADCTQEATALVRRSWESLRCKQVRALLEKALLWIAEADEHGGLTNERKKLILSLVASAHNLLNDSAVTEDGFVDPVCERVRTHLATAIDALNATDAKKKLKTIKKEVKQAANLL